MKVFKYIIGATFILTGISFFAYFVGYIDYFLNTLKYVDFRINNPTFYPSLMFSIFSTISNILFGIYLILKKTD